MSTTEHSRAEKKHGPPAPFPDMGSTGSRTNHIVTEQVNRHRLEPQPVTWKPGIATGSRRVIDRETSCHICGMSMPLGSSFRLRKRWTASRARVSHITCPRDLPS